MNISKKNSDAASGKGVIKTAQIDLRAYLPSALENITKLTAAIVILPKEKPADFMAAYSGIQKTVAAELYLAADEILEVLNGVTVLDCRNTDSKTTYLANGITVFTHCDTEEPLQVAANGITVYDNRQNLHFAFANGTTACIPFTIENTAVFPNDALLDRVFLQDIAPQSVIAVGAKLTLAADVDRQLLKSKPLYFLAGATITCNKAILGTVQSMAIAGQRIRAKRL